MKLNKREKKGVAIWCAWLAIIIPALVWAKDWASIIWQVTFTACLVLFARMQRVIDAQDEAIKWRDEHYNMFSVRIFEKRNECLMKDCSRYLATIARLRQENEQLKILNKNEINLVRKFFNFTISTRWSRKIVLKYHISSMII